ncbi:MAG: hypothetical protein ACJAZD_002564 [Ilumatobacter sp.]
MWAEERVGGGLFAAASAEVLIDPNLHGARSIGAGAGSQVPPCETTETMKSC